MFYETIAGQTWDEIALDVYGSEIYAGFLMQNNPKHIATMIFSAGTLLYIPELPAEADESYPDWRN